MYLCSLATHILLQGHAGLAVYWYAEPACVKYLCYTMLKLRLLTGLHCRCGQYLNAVTVFLLTRTDLMSDIVTHLSQSCANKKL